MPAQVVLDGAPNGAPNGSSSGTLNGASNGTLNSPPSPEHTPSPGRPRHALIDTEGFQWGEVDDKFMRLAGHHDAARVLAANPAAAALVTPPAIQLPPLGPLAHFKGSFAGTGMNLIFRPTNSSTKIPSPFVPPTPAFPAVPNDSILEINLTEETLSFADPLGDVPNRGFNTQRDIHLNGVPYVQSVNDVTNTGTGRADAPPKGIHFEPGVWMHVPASTDPTGTATLNRMASIPHGTTINAQGVSPTTAIAGPPNFKLPQNQVDITPFKIGDPGNRLNDVFPSQKVESVHSARLPQDLTKFVEEGTITQDILDNPNVVLAKAIEGQKITETIVFKVTAGPQGVASTTTTPNPIGGGGPASIDFLNGDDKGDGPNADVPFMSATFWIETVEQQVTLPPFPPGRQGPVRVRPRTANARVPAPTFLVHPPAQHITTPRTVAVKSTQIQYSQTVLLNFATLSWPHVSVGTLVPSDDVTATIHL
ncbi:uncharacterized protein LTR77_004024 [Saxophila tyrrhenica]|uniref:Uncharacterized protein n=1 Tax=Saxophila tyrrhenica TaxID=1690608 RepID=A0AAV9PCA6_9PEZI|nr:hypothetical protein LTR77_004024 [Saxophila tyrrhenica]